MHTNISINETIAHRHNRQTDSNCNNSISLHLKTDDALTSVLAYIVLLISAILIIFFHRLIVIIMFIYNKKLLLLYVAHNYMSVSIYLTVTMSTNSRDREQYSCMLLTLGE